MINKGTKENFQELISKGNVIVDFWAPWCGPCRAMTPVLEDIDDDEIENLSIVTVNVDDQPELAREYRVLSIPALKLFRDGVLSGEALGAMPKEALLQQLGL